MPEPIITPMTTMVESNRPRPRAKVRWAGAFEGWFCAAAFCEGACGFIFFCAVGARSATVTYWPRTRQRRSGRVEEVKSGAGRGDSYNISTQRVQGISAWMEGETTEGTEKNGRTRRDGSRACLGPSCRNVQHTRCVDRRGEGGENRRNRPNRYSSAWRAKQAKISIAGENVCCRIALASCRDRRWRARGGWLIESPGQLDGGSGRLLVTLKARCLRVLRARQERKGNAAEPGRVGPSECNTSVPIVHFRASLYSRPAAGQ